MTNNWRFSLVLSCLLCFCNVQAQTTNIKPEPFPIPLDSVSQLHYLVPLVNDSLELDSNLIILYGFTGCKPCEVLIRKVQRKIESEEIKPSSVVYVNIFVLDKSDKTKRLKDANTAFRYYATEDPYVGNIDGAFPMIVAYSGGLKKWSIFGYSPSNNRKMMQFLKQKK